ncbi:MAG: hypothetical protein R6W80_16030 [Haliea sp.]
MSAGRCRSCRDFPWQPCCISAGCCTFKQFYFAAGDLVDGGAELLAFSAEEEGS